LTVFVLGKHHLRIMVILPWELWGSQPALRTLSLVEVSMSVMPMTGSESWVHECSAGPHSLARSRHLTH